MKLRTNNLDNKVFLFLLYFIYFLNYIDFFLYGNKNRIDPNIFLAV